MPSAPMPAAPMPPGTGPHPQAGRRTGTATVAVPGAMGGAPVVPRVVATPATVARRGPLVAVAADDALVDPARNFTVRVAVGPRVCALLPTNQPDPQYPGLTNKPDNPDLFQVGMSIQPGISELGPFSLMSFNAYLSPPFTDLFEFTWELDGQVVPRESGPTLLKPYWELSKTPDGMHLVTLTAKGAREYLDATDPRLNVLPFNGGTRTVTCQFQGQP